MKYDMSLNDFYTSYVANTSYSHILDSREDDHYLEHTQGWKVISYYQTRMFRT
jgi:hypothetical protein